MLRDLSSAGQHKHKHAGDDDGKGLYTGRQSGLGSDQEGGEDDGCYHNASVTEEDGSGNDVAYEEFAIGTSHLPGENVLQGIPLLVGDLHLHRQAINGNEAASPPLQGCSPSHLQRDFLIILSESYGLSM